MARQLSFAKALDHVLRPLGFHRTSSRRRDKEWLREVEGCEESVVLQFYPHLGATANLAARDSKSASILDDTVPPNSPGLWYPVTRRIGEIMDGNDRWWRQDENGPSELATAISTHAPAFFAKYRGLSNQAAMFGRGVAAWRTPTDRLYLAIALWRMGEAEEAREALRNPPKGISEAWLKQFAALDRLFASRSGLEETDPRLAD